MELQELRDALITYIQLADEKKLEALHILLITEQEEEVYQSWKDESFVKELNEDYKKYESGEEKGYTEEEAFAIIESKQKENTPVHV